MLVAFVSGVLLVTTLSPDTELPVFLADLMAIAYTPLVPQSIVFDEKTLSDPNLMPGCRLP